MAYEIRAAKAEEMAQVGLMAAYVYGGEFGDEADNITATSLKPEWTLCAFDGPKLITSFGAFPFTMRANGTAISFAGITAVGTLPEYRRQGLVRQIMTQALADEKERGQSIAGLWASQAAIYQRYGFAPAGYNRSYSIDSTDIKFADGDPGSCQVTRPPSTQGIEAARAVYREFIANRFGYLHRSQLLWHNNVFETGEDGPVHAAVAYQNGEPRGYIAYTLRADKVPHAARPQEIKIRDFAWLDIDAYRSIWSYLAHHDLVGRVSWRNAPMDDPAPLIMQEPRLLHWQDEEGSWMRLVDVPLALEQRGYTGQGRVVIGVVGDDFGTWNNGAWQLETDTGEAQVTATANEPDVVVSIGVLSSLYTGMFSARHLRSAGLLRATPEVVSTLDGIFASDSKPHCPDHY